jgi:hypothetical protein
MVQTLYISDETMTKMTSCFVLLLTSLRTLEVTFITFIEINVDEWTDKLVFPK